MRKVNYARLSRDGFKSLNRWQHPWYAMHDEFYISMMEDGEAAYFMGGEL